MGTEVRVMREGELRFVRASGVGSTWATASAPVSGIMGYVQSLSFTSAQTITTISERGTPNHHKLTERSPIDVTFECLWTGSFPTAVSGSGATLPMWHLEHRASAGEVGNGTTGDFHQFHGAALISHQWTEAREGNRIALTFRCLAYVGPTGSGFLS